jgi:hypothetical protein
LYYRKWKKKRASYEVRGGHKKQRQQHEKEYKNIVFQNRFNSAGASQSVKSLVDTKECYNRVAAIFNRETKKGIIKAR